MMDSLARHGFRKFLIMNSHGGNSPGIQVLQQKLMHTWSMKDDRSDELEVYSRFAWGGNLDQPGMRTLGASGSGHAGETETSMIMHLRPDLVKASQQQHTSDSAGY